MPGSAHGESFQLLVDGLRRARARLHRAHVCGEVARGLHLAATIGIGLAAAGALAVLIARAAGHPLGPALAWAASIAAGGAILAILARLLPAMLAEADLIQAAQRLDLSADNHNRIATALEFARNPDAPPFAAAAIADGMTSLRALEDAIPHLPQVNWRSRRNVGLLVAAAAALIVVCLIPMPRAVLGAGSEEMPLRLARAIEPATPVDESKKPTPEPALPQSTPITAALTQRQLASKATNLADDSQSGVNSAATVSGAPATGSPTARQQKPGASKPPQTPPTTPGENPQSPNEPKGASTAAQNQSAAADAPTSAASATSGGKGGSSQKTLAVTNDWQSHEKAGDQAKDVADDESAESGQPTESQHHGGLQPVLQDRRQSPNRELGLSGALKGKPGNGRSGPSAQKKSRGAGALLLGVPLPDFIHGRLLPGTSRLMRQLIPPLRMLGELAGVVSAAPRSIDEPPVPRFDVPPDALQAVQRYFTALHRDADEASAMVPSPANGALNQTKDKENPK